MSRNRKRLAKQLGPIGLLTAAALGALGFAGCSGDDSSVGTCVSTETYFAEQTWPIFGKKCIACHTATGLAKNSKMVLHQSSEAGYLDTNLEIVRNVAAYKVDNKSELLLKPTNTISHGGGLQVAKGGAEYGALEGLLARFEHPVDCETDVASFFADVELLGWEKTVRKAALTLAGRLPTDAETKAAHDAGEAGFDAVVDGMMTEDVFIDRVKQIYNDQFLTDRYIGGDDALQLLGDLGGDDGYYSPNWYENATDVDVKKYGAAGPGDLQNKLATWTNQGVAREPVELIAHVVKNDRPFTEILTANYMVVNPFSAKAYGVTDAKFENDADPAEFAEAHIGGYGANGYPHAGVLTSPMFLIRHPTTETNVNRHRSRMVYLYFLGTDILKTAEQPLDPTKITDFNPTMNNPSCTVCHANIDPIAGTFHTMGDMGQYNPDDKWIDSMRPPGFAGEQLPTEEFPRSLQWLASRVSKDPRFALSAVYIMFEGLTGQKPLVPPSDTKATGFSHTFKGYLAQYHTFNTIAKQFIESNYNLKVVVKAILKSPYFRATNATVASSDRKLELAELGTGQFVIPEQLARKIYAITGYPWTFNDNIDGVDTKQEFLARNDQYHILYGGIDSNDVVTRTRDPNGVMANIADRMANEMACLAVPHDFNHPMAERRLFNKVELTYEPKDANGFDVVPAVKAIKEQIQALHKQVLGEELAIDDREIQRTYDLFVSIYQDGQAGMKKADAEMPYSKSLPGACQVRNDFWTNVDLPEEQMLTEDSSYTLRAWMGVMSYLLSDYSFLYE